MTPARWADLGVAVAFVALTWAVWYVLFDLGFWMTVVQR